MKINGNPVAPSDSIRVTVNNFLATAGDGFSRLLLGTNLIGGAQDIDALEAYMAPSLGSGPDFSPPATNRITAFTGPVPVISESPSALLVPIFGIMVVGAVALWFGRRFSSIGSQAFIDSS